MSGSAFPSELDVIARRAIDANHDMTLGTTDHDRRPRLSPVYDTCARYADFLRHTDICPYVAHLRSCEVHVPGSHPIHGRGIDTRQPADPASPVRE